MVHGCGLDEISPLGASTVFEVRNVAAPGQKKVYATKRFEFDPLSVGVPRCSIEGGVGGACVACLSVCLSACLSLSFPIDPSNPIS